MTAEISQLQIGDNGTTEVVVEEGRSTLRKTLHLEGDQKAIVEIFNRECELLSEINHPRLPKLLKYEVQNNQISLVLEMREGSSLLDLLDSRIGLKKNSSKPFVTPTDFSQIIRWSRELAEAIIFLHSQRPFPLIHRNINPSTIRVATSDQGIMLLDFGFLNSFHRKADFTVLGPFNHPGLIWDFWGEAQADIYGFGKVLGFLLTGQVLGRTDLAAEKANIAAGEDGFQHVELAKIADRCCNLNIETRYKDMDAVAHDLIRLGEKETRPSSRITCWSCGDDNRASARFCGTCNQLLRRTTDPPNAAQITTLMTFEDQAESKLLNSYERGRFAKLARYRMRELLDEVESDPGFEELLSLANLPEVAKMQHQKETVLRALQRMRGRALFADEVGLGKTVEAGIFLKELLLRGLTKKILIVCPSTLLAAQWQSELYEKFGEIALVFGHDIDTSLAWHCARLITTYDTLRQPFHVEELLRHTYDLVILDEAHFLNDRENLSILETVKRLQKKYFLMLSATPMHKSLRELYNIVTLLRPGHFADLASFEREFIDADNEMQAKNVETLRELLHQIMIRNRRQDITDYVFPKRKAVLRQLVLDGRAMTFYNEFRDFLKAGMADVSNTAVLSNVGDLAERLCSSPDAFSAQINRLRRNWKVRRILGDSGLRKLENFAVTYPASMVQPKLNATIEILKKHTGNRERALAFSQFDETARYFHRRLQETELKPVCFLYDPQSSLISRQAAIKKLEETPGGILICPGEASEGLNLQFASLMVNLDLPWNPMKLEQRIGRIQRIGGKKDVLIFNLVLQGTIEEKIYEICSERIKMFEAIVGHVEEILGNLREEEDIQVLIRDFYLDRRVFNDEGSELSAEDNLTRALDEAEDKSSKEAEESLSYIYGSSHFDPSTAQEDEDFY